MKLRTGRIAFVTLSLFVLMGATDCQKNQEEKVAVAKEMAEAFGKGCGRGPWTQASVDRAAQISGLFQSLLNKQGCNNNPNVQTALNASNALQTELTNMMGPNSNVGTERQWEEVSNDLLVQINQTTDADIRASLISEYGTARYNLSNARANANYLSSGDYHTQMYYGFEAVNQHLREILAASNSLADCYNNNPAVAMQLGSSLAELGGAFAPPMIGAGISALSSLIQTAVDYSVKAPTARAVYDATRPIMPDALTCGLEAMTRDYCKARDARNLIDFSLKGTDGQLLPFFYGTDLQDRYMPALYGWLDKVVNGGGTIRNPNHAGIVNGQFGRLAVARASLNTAQGYFEDFRTAIQRDPSSEVDRVKSLLKILAHIFYQHSDGPFPFNDESSLFFGYESSQAFVIKISGKQPQGQPQSLDQLVESLPISAGDFNVVENEFSKLYKLRFDLMMIDFNQKVQVSAPLTVKAFRDRDFTGLSPKIAWDRMYSFFDQYAYPPGSDADFDKVAIGEFHDRVQPLFTALADPNSVSERCTPNPNPDPHRPRDAVCIPPSTQVLSTAHETFKLEDNTNNFLPKVVGDFVHSDLVNRACRGETPKQLKDIIKIGGQDLTALMQRASITSPAALKADISSAQTISLGSLAQFRKFYLPAITWAMQDLKDLADKSKEPPPGGPNSPVRDQLSKLCILTYISGMSTSEFDFSKFCGDAKLRSTGDIVMSFRDLVRHLEGKPQDDRICAYESFLRVDRLKNQAVPTTMCTDDRKGPRFHGFASQSVRSEEFPRDTQDQTAFWQKALFAD
jgi:hypothetical protein